MQANKRFGGFMSPATATAIATLLLCSAAQAATPVSWIGGSGFWYDESHWSTGGWPASTDDVMLGTGVPGAVTLVSLLGSTSSFYWPVEIGSLAVGANTRLNIDNASLRVRGGIVNDGVLALGTNSGNSGTGNRLLRIAADVTLAGAGTVDIQAGMLDLGMHTLTVGSAQTVRGSGVISYGNIVNQGLLLAENGGLGFNTTGSQIDNTAGRINIAANSTLWVNGTIITGGRVDVGSGGTLSSSAVMMNSTFSNVTFTGDAKVRGFMELADSTNMGTLRFNEGAYVFARGTLVNNGDIHVDSTGNTNASALSFLGDGRLTGGGTVWLQRTNIGSGGVIEVDANHTLTIDNGQTVRGTGTFRGNENFRIVNNGSVIAEGGKLYVSLYDGGAWDNSNGHITVAHDGRLDIDGPLILGDASTLTFDVGSNAADHGMLRVITDDPIALDGTLQLNLGYGAQVGDSFMLLTSYGGETGTFDQVIAAGYTVSTSYSVGDVTVTITGISPVLEPATWLLASTGLVMLRRRLRK